MYLVQAIEQYKESLNILIRINSKNKRIKKTIQVIEWLEELKILREEKELPGGLMMNIKYMPQYKDATGAEQYEKIKEEVEEARVECLLQADANEDQEIADAIQALANRWCQKGKTKTDIDKIWKKHYEKEELRGREVIEIL